METSVNLKIDKVSPGTIISVKGKSNYLRIDKVMIQPFPSTIWSKWPADPEIMLAGHIVEWNGFEERWHKTGAAWQTDIKSTDVNETCLSLSLFQKKLAKGKITFRDEEGLIIDQPAFMGEQDFYPGEWLTLKNGRRATVTEITLSKVGYATEPNARDKQWAARSLPVYATLLALYCICCVEVVVLADRANLLLAVAAALISLIAFVVIASATFPGYLEIETEQTSMLQSKIIPQNLISSV